MYVNEKTKEAQKRPKNRYKTVIQPLKWEGAPPLKKRYVSGY